MVRVGIVGIGFMGWIHWLAYQKIPGAHVAAIVSRDPQKRAGDWTSVKGNFGPPGTQVDLSEVSVYATVDELLADDTIELVDICLPPNLHPDVAIQAFNRGKHVVCEKPLALTVQDCDRIVDAARSNDRRLLVAHVLPFFPEYEFVVQSIRSGTYGPLLGGEFKRAIADPVWLADYYDLEKIGGPLVDLHVHDAHFIRVLFGMPSAVMSSGRCRDGVVQYCATIYKYSDAPFVVSSVCSVVNQQGRPFMHGFEVHFERATIQFAFAGFADEPELMPMKVLTEDGQVQRPTLRDGDPANAFVPELAEVIDVVAGNQPESPLLDGQYARDAIVLCHRQSQSVLENRLVEI